MTALAPAIQYTEERVRTGHTENLQRSGEMKTEWRERKPPLFFVYVTPRMKKCTGKSASQSPRRAHWIKPALSSELDKLFISQRFGRG